MRGRISIIIAGMTFDRELEVKDLIELQMKMEDVHCGVAKLNAAWLDYQRIDTADAIEFGKEVFDKCYCNRIA